MRLSHSRLWLALLALGLITFVLWPLPTSFEHGPVVAPRRITDRQGQLLYELRSPEWGSQQFIALEEMPASVVEALLATEDRTFYWHLGVSARGTLRALWQNLRAGRVVSGGSTVTQQLVRHYLQPERRNVPYKLREALLAVKLELRTTKEEILERYLNTAYFGHQAYGIGAAAQTYFGKRVAELSVSEVALLIGLLQSPSVLDPFANFTAAKERQQLVLKAMYDQNYLTETAWEQWRHLPLKLARDRVALEAPHFVMWLQQTRADDLREPVTTTTLDLDLQRDIERIVDRQLLQLQGQNVSNAAVVVLDAKQGDILAMIGSSNYYDPQIDGAVNVATAPRQPGSTLKPFTYALALERGDTVATTVADVAVQFFTQDGNPYTPRNFDYGYHGLVRYREALANSYNISAVKVLEKIGVETLLTFLRDVGISTLTKSPEHYGLALTLGDGEVTLLELTQAYGLLARGGQTLHARALLDDPVQSGTQKLDPITAWLITDVLSDATARIDQFGEDNPLSFPYPVAAKTGTTRNNRDNWLLGYTPDYVIGVWVGNADNSPMRDTSGITGAGPIFRDIVTGLHRENIPTAFTQPTGIIEQEICSISGQLPSKHCPHAINEVFRAGTEPTIIDQIFSSIPLDRRNGLHASADCDPRFVTEQVFATFPPELTRWARENGWPEAPREYSPLCGEVESVQTGSWLQILKPRAGDTFQIDPLIPAEDQQLVLEAEASPDIKTVEWLINEKSVGIGVAPTFRVKWTLSPGSYTLRASAAGQSESLRLRVEEAF